MKLFCSFSVRGGTLVTVSKRLDKHLPRVVGLKMATYYIFIKNSCSQCLFRHWFPSQKLTPGGSTARLPYAEFRPREWCLESVTNVSLAKIVNASLTHSRWRRLRCLRSPARCWKGDCRLQHQAVSDHGDGGSSCTCMQQTTQNKCRNEEFSCTAHWRNARHYFQWN